MSVIREIWKALQTIAKQVVNAVFKHYIQFLAGLVIVGITSVTSFLSGVKSADVFDLVAKQNRFGGHCIGPLIRLNDKNTVGFSVSRPSIRTAQVCGGATKGKATAEDALTSVLFLMVKLRRSRFMMGTMPYLRYFKMATAKTWLPAIVPKIRPS